jgi:hypothetical protein
VTVTGGSLTVAALPGQALGTLSTTTTATGRTYVYSIVSVNGVANNGQFAIVGDQLLTGANISPSAGMYSVVIQTTDADRPDLTAQTTFGIGTTAAVVPPTLSASGSGTFDPSAGPVSLNLAATVVGNNAISSVTVNWGDGTIQMLPGLPSTVTHQYANLDKTYEVTFSATDADGTFPLPTPLTYTAVLPTPTEAVVGQLYMDVLGRSADVAGLQNFSAQIEAGVSVATVVQALQSSAEYQTNVVNDLYVKYLGRQADPKGLADGVSFLQNGGDPRVLAANLIASQEFYTNAGGTDEGFLRALYQTVLGRDIDASGLESNLTQLQSVESPQVRPTEVAAERQRIAQALIFSQEARLATAEAFYAQYLGRAGDAAGVMAHANQLATQPETTVADSFLTSPEFQQMAATP